MAIAKNTRKIKSHYQCLLCDIITANRGGHLEWYHDVEVNRFTMRGIIGTDEQESFFSKYFIITTEATTSQQNRIDYNAGMQHAYAIRIRDRKK